MFEKIISGGQTGVDRAALDTALELGIPCGGWCPRGRRAEDGPIADGYPLRETPSRDYRVRTWRNVEEAHGTLILTWRRPAGGTALTIKLAGEMGKPTLIIDLAEGGDASQVRAWGEAQGIRVLNVAGPREGEAPGVYGRARNLLREILRKEA